MNTKVRSVAGRITRKTALAAGTGALAVTTIFATGVVHLPGSGGSSASPLVATAPALSSSTVAPLIALNHATEAVADRILPAVVTITVAGTQNPQQGSGPSPQDIPAPFQQFFHFQGPTRPQPFEAAGTGIIVAPDGYIVTNNHVVNGASTVQVTLHNQQQYTAKVVGTDKDSDLAVVKINATGLTSAAFGDSSKVKPGEIVLAVGDPLDESFSVTRGIVSAVNRNRAINDGPNSRGSYIQTDAPINHGNSGGPLVDIYGNVIGINTEMLSTSGASAGIGFAIPSNLVKTVAAELIKTGKVERGYLGIFVADLTPEIAGSLNEPNVKGALVDSVTSGGPAAAAGLKPYDVVTEINGRKISNSSELQSITGDLAPGSTASLNVLRDGKPMHITVTLGNYANANATTATASATTSGSAETPKLGITAEPITPAIRQQLGLPSNVNGLVVDSVNPASPAMMAGISRGDVIEQVNQKPVTTVAELQAQLKATPAGRSVLLMVHNQSGDFILPVKPEENK